MKYARTLSRDEMKHVMAGDDGNCRIAVRNSETGAFMYWSQPVFSVEEAQTDYENNQAYTNDGYASGYCCASCGEPGFNNF